MSNPSVATEQLLELLLTLKKTTPQAARSILNAQPAIAYALITLMVSMNAISIEVFQKTLAEFGAANSTSLSLPTTTTTSPSSIPQLPQPQPPTILSHAPIPISAIPPYLQPQYRVSTPPTTISTPPTHTPTPPYGYSQQQQHPHPPTAAQPSNGGYHLVGGGGGGGYNGYPPPVYPPQQTTSTPIPNAQQPTVAPGLSEALADIPPDQKALILRVITMTPEQIKMLPAAERATYIQIRTTLGIPTD